MLESLDGRVMPDATPLGAPPDTPPGQTEPGAVVLDNLQPGSWVALDGTTTIVQDGVWLAVGAEGDVWVVTQVTSNPTFYQIGSLDVPPAGETNDIDGANFMQPPFPLPPAPQGAPVLPPPVIPPITNTTNIGALGGGLMGVNPATSYDQYIGLGVGISITPSLVEGGTSSGLVYFEIPHTIRITRIYNPGVEAGWRFRFVD